MCTNSVNDRCTVIIILFISYTRTEEIVSTLPNADTNIALNKPTRSKAGYSSRANDGNKATQWPSNSCFHTNTADSLGLWWQVDFGKEYPVAKVKITNRGDCCPERLSDFSLDVFDHDPELNPQTPAKNCNFHAGTVAAGVTLTIDCQEAVQGQYLRVTKMTPHLQFCEVEVFVDAKGRFEPCGSFTQKKERRSSSSAVIYFGPEITTRAECAKRCSVQVTCTGFNFRIQPDVACQLVEDVNDGSLISDPSWNFYPLKPCWKKCN